MASAIKKLSSHLLEMKFMKKSKEDREKLDEQEKYAQVFESDQVKEENTGAHVTYQPNQAILEDLVFARRSYGGENPAIEKLMAEHDGVTAVNDVSGADHVTDGCDVSDRQMADHYNSLADTIGKKFERKRHQSPHPESEQSEPRTPSRPPPHKRPRQFRKPNEDGFV